MLFAFETSINFLSININYEKKKITIIVQLRIYQLASKNSIIFTISIKFIRILFLINICENRYFYILSNSQNYCQLLLSHL